ncbi:MAG: HAMP domain-containing protein [Planctomycetia bacterium]|nr:HAMP domain-containing protein [Planctomycetia bacterium]
MAEITEQVAAGDYDVSIRAESRDEIGRLAEKFNVMVTKLRAYHELNLRRIVGEEKKADAILQTIDDGVLVVDSQRTVTSLNPAALRALNIGAGRVEGVPFATVVHDERLCRLIDETLVSGKPPRPDDRQDFITIPGAEERHLYFEYALTPIASHDETVLGVVVLLRNVTKLKELDRLKTEFVMTASHELRTPLTSIGMSVELLRERLGDQVNESDRQLFDVAHEELERLRKLVEELLNLSKIESGKLEMDFAQVSLSEVVRTAVAPFQAQVERQGLELSVETEDDIPPVTADANKLAWVVTNLVGNALRYARSHIWVSAECGGRWPSIYVRDDGSGIPYNMQARIFDKFVQTGDRDRAGGAGLGLAMAKEIVRVHGGHIWVESQPGCGSLFTIALPSSDHSSGARP